MSSTQVNEHYLDHVVALSQSSEIQASEDIVSGNGVKLVAKGTRIDARVRERLLAHKLSKPLESMMRVVESVSSRPIDRVALSLLERHPLLSSLCGAATAQLLASRLNHLILSPQMDSLISVYASQGDGKLEHAVGVALLAAALAEDLPQASCDTGTLMLAGLVHDVGELYIDPNLLKGGQRLTAQQWKHIASHPIVGARVVREMAGGGPQVAQVVLHHHERLDGFGYPQGLGASSMPLAGQVLAVSEMLMGLMESGAHAAERAAVAMRLVPGEFNRLLLDRVVTQAKAARAAAPPTGAVETASLLAALQRVNITLDRVKTVRQRIRDEQASYGAELRDLLAHAIARAERLMVALASTGLQDSTGEALKQRLEALTATERLEVTLVARELQWRLNELERQLGIRCEALPQDEALRVQALIADSKPEAMAAVVA